MDDLTTFVARELDHRRDPASAVAMAAYMKTDMPFYGVKSPQLREVQRSALQRFPVTSRAEYEAAVVALWTQPHREEKRMAVGFARAYPDYVTMDSLPLYRRLIVEGGWWDFVDEVAAHLVGGVLGKQRQEMSAVLDQWIDDPDMWLRRTALISQLRHKGDTDQDRLFRYCLARADEKEFFIRKAIGWSLREYAKTDPAAVRRFVLENRDVWSGLTFREATKHLDVS